MLNEKTLIKGKQYFWKSALMYVLVLFMGKGCDFFIELDPRVNLLGCIFLFFPLVMVMITSKPSPVLNKQAVALIFTTLLLWFVYHLTIDAFTPYYQGLQLILAMILGLIVARYYSDEFSLYFEKAVINLTIVGLVAYIAMYFIGHDTFASFAPFPNAYHPRSFSYGIYTVSRGLQEANGLFGLYRNCGFCWEPGAYAGILVITLSIAMSRIKTDLFKNRKIVILLIALSTTFSTTGYVAIIILFFMKSLSGKMSFVKKTTYLSLLVIFGMFLINLPFMREKIELQSNFDNFFINTENVYIGESGHRTVERFEGMYLSWLNLTDEPIFGYGPNENNSFSTKMFPMFIISNGNVLPIASFGVILGIMFFAYFYWGTRRILQWLNSANVSLLFVGYILVSSSYNYMYTIISMSILFLGFIRPRRNDNKNVNLEK